MSLYFLFEDPQPLLNMPIWFLTGDINSLLLGS